ncbi:conserved hypothetical protein [Xylanimonas cellulosilytica DSM 15894]|uniref:DUF3866 domain-containing protein n=1 Tax=Xylanimonas cellulosilytica (strain DSM 15894 / JCM 12276 / CECT 5975 / KCTC 9989 / LMG 20990 / NBRC 107835 / XIL07) TaxID=446471 RepID=D1BSW2_XYLCX|nr:DUF3866 family protein [Xylanimonas cellulosilytica]ACZ30804.1 conserved hypothetical protein [Xylanimonas cellulosilytica DSM 15894]
MITWRTGTVVSRGKTWGAAHRAARELDVELDRPLPGDTDATTRVRALAYTTLVGDPHPGDTLLLNCSALARGLGTGGYALVAGPVGTLPDDPPPGPGHLVKARYTPLQAMVLGVDEQESPHHHTLQDADTLDDLPVVVADLHSALPAIIAGARHAAATHGRPTPRIAYVMTDGGALPAAFSRTIATLHDHDWLHTTITVGQAFGGDLEAVTTHTGLLAAHHITHADLAIVTQGPGNLGTGTRWGYSGVAAGEAINATSTLGGRAIASLRVSGADPRDRHRGISHHSLTAYGRVALTPADIPLPVPTHDLENLPAWGPALTTRIREQITTLAATHRLTPVPADAHLLTALAASPARLSTMGRGLDADPAAFVAAAVAGVHAEGIAARRR